MHNNKRLAWLFAVLILAGCHATSDVVVTPATRIGDGVPQTAQPFLNDPDQFQFVLIGDRTGRHRPGVFAQAMQQINLLRPEFVIGVGDHIEGYTEDPVELDRQWQELDDLVNRLDMRFFYVAGNHDISNDTMRQDWLQRRGQEYYHFLYKDVLFIALSTEDPPGTSADAKQARLTELGVDQAELNAAMELFIAEPEKARELLVEKPYLAEAFQVIRETDQVAISDEQVAYIRSALEQHQDVRWTMVLMHKPAWKYDSPAFEQIETLLRDRPHTFFAGHLHTYSYLKQGQSEYIQMGTTGGIMNKDPEYGAAMDHVLWITMTAEGPEIANLELNSIHDRTGPRPSDRTADH